jgi:hypothetical protein
LYGGTIGGFFIIGAFSYVMTAITPSAPSAAAVSILEIVPLAMVL